MRRLAPILLLAALVTPGASQAQTLVPLSAHASIEVFQSLSIAQLWNSTAPESARGKNVTVISRMFDSEARPIRGKLHGCGWLLIGTGDVASRPIGIRIWTDSQCDLRVAVVPEATAGGDERFMLRLASSEAFEIRIDANESVSIAGHPLGTIE